MNDGWDLQAVVRSCAPSTTASSAAQSTADAAVFTSTATATSISFDDGRSGSAQDQPSTFSNFISFSMQPVDSEYHGGKRKSKSSKRVVEMRENELSNDGWAWRKYGKKPIKGSPYPRNYYRCSTTKDCLARKQVERSHVDASTFIVSYSGNHLHPRPTHLSSLADTTRSIRYTDLPEQPPCSSSSPASTSSFSPATSLKEDETEMNDEDILEAKFW